MWFYVRELRHIPRMIAMFVFLFFVFIAAIIEGFFYLFCFKIEKLFGKKKTFKK